MVKTKQTPVLQIVMHDGNWFDVFAGERYTTCLTWDEMLGQVASITHKRIDSPRYEMSTPEELEEKRARRNSTRASE